MLTRARLWDLLRRAQGVARLERRLAALRADLDAYRQHREALEAEERQLLGVRIAELDSRLSFHNLSQRLPPQPDKRRQWCVASVMARNEGLRLARGSWFLAFDDDDHMYPDAIERLLTHARDHRAEVVYGRFRQIRPDGPVELGQFPPTLGQFTWQSGICHGSLRFFERQLFAAEFDAPNDIFMAEAM